jgi:glucokinase
MKYCIGIDIGGTNIKAGLLDLEGRLVTSKARRLSAFYKGRVGIVEICAAVIDELASENSVSREDIIGCGIGAPGAIDVPGGVVTRSPHFPEWENFAMRQALSERLKMRVELENDVNAIARGEQWCGAAQGERNFLCLAWGTGFGGGICLDGRIWRGVRGMAGEIGHINSDPEGVPCNCGSRGCIETLASQTALIRRVKEDDFRRCSTVWSRTQTFRVVCRSLRVPETPRLAFIGPKWARRLEFMLAGVLDLLDLKLLLFCGGLSRSLDLFSPMMIEFIRRYSYPAVHDGLEIRCGQLWEDAGVYGSAANLLFEMGIFKV